ncbi:MAG: MOSC domain-containing protein [Euryarchaeota archaeon]|nr:MOSC domain-containing protein [Euryarchaeota archaeon]
MHGEAEGAVVAVHRYAVKSMMGEELHAAEVTERGLLGDRAYALVDVASGKIASAKNPRLWGRLFEFRAAYVEAPRNPARPPPVRITLPDGAVVTSLDAQASHQLSKALGREVRLTAQAPETPSLEEYWPDIEGLAHREEVTEEAMHARTFFDSATLHLLTTSTIDKLRHLSPGGRFETRRFRPNLVVRTPRQGFVENGWVGHELALGEEVVLRVERPCGRCVMTTLPQGDLPRDPSILRAAAQHNAANVGVYASVVRGGTVHRGDEVRVRA